VLASRLAQLFPADDALAASKQKVAAQKFSNKVKCHGTALKKAVAVDDNEQHHDDDRRQSGQLGTSHLRRALRFVPQSRQLRHNGFRERHPDEERSARHEPRLTRSDDVGHHPHTEGNDDLTAFLDSL
jgi:hypothetical protein